GLGSRLTAQRAQHLVCHCDRGVYQSSAGARFEERLRKRTPAAGPHELEMAERGPAENLRTCRIRCQRLCEGIADTHAQSTILQPDEINDDAAPEIAQPDLARDPLGGFEIGGEPAALGRSTLRAAAINVDQHPG